jgi:hypothetical protein
MPDGMDLPVPLVPGEKNQDFRIGKKDPSWQRQDTGLPGICHPGRFQTRIVPAQGQDNPFNFKIHEK